MDIDKEDINYSFAQKWSPEIEQYNFTQIPNLLLGCQGHLGLKDGEMITLIHLLTFWFSGQERVFPSIRTLTKFSGNGYSTIQKRLRSLEDKGFLVRKHRMHTSNSYVLTGCIKQLIKHQRICESPPRSRSIAMLNLKRYHPYVITKKEYEVRKRTSADNDYE